MIAYKTDKWHSIKFDGYIRFNETKLKTVDGNELINTLTIQLTKKPYEEYFYYPSKIQNYDSEKKFRERLYEKFKDSEVVELRPNKQVEDDYDDSLIELI